MSKDKEKLEALAAMESATTHQSEVPTPIAKPTYEPIVDNSPNTIDGYFTIDRSELPQGGIFYPESWAFVARCPEAEEVAIFSTFNPRDQIGIMKAVDELIRKCITIYDQDTENKISAINICDFHKIYFFLKLREVYLSNNPILLDAMCSTCHNEYKSNLFANNLQFPYPSDNLISIFDGRVFHFDFETHKIKVHIPTLKTSATLLNMVNRVYTSKANPNQKTSNDKQLQRFTKICYDKIFLLIAPILFETGDESFAEIAVKYERIHKDKELFELYLEVANNLHFENYESVETTCESCGALEDTEIRFPDYNKMFTKSASGNKFTKKYFG